VNLLLLDRVSDMTLNFVLAPLTVSFSSCKMGSGAPTIRHRESLFWRVCMGPGRGESIFSRAVHDWYTIYLPRPRDFDPSLRKSGMTTPNSSDLIFSFRGGFVGRDGATWSSSLFIFYFLYSSWIEKFMVLFIKSARGDLCRQSAFG
jgi:hypothetical protein